MRLKSTSLAALGMTTVLPTMTLWSRTRNAAANLVEQARCIGIDDFDFDRAEKCRAGDADERRIGRRGVRDLSSHLGAPEYRVDLTFHAQIRRNRDLDARHDAADLDH